MRNPFEGFIEDIKMSHQSFITVKIERRPHLFGNPVDGNPLTMKFVIFILEEMHLLSNCGMQIAECGMKKLSHFET
jgi:hypothetical protein